MEIICEQSDESSSDDEMNTVFQTQFTAPIWKDEQSLLTSFTNEDEQIIECIAKAVGV